MVLWLMACTQGTFTVDGAIQDRSPAFRAEDILLLPEGNENVLLDGSVLSVVPGTVETPTTGRLFHGEVPSPYVPWSPLYTLAVPGPTLAHPLVLEPVGLPMLDLHPYAQNGIGGWYQPDADANRAVTLEDGSSVFFARNGPVEELHPAPTIGVLDLLLVVEATDDPGFRSKVEDLVEPLRLELDAHGLDYHVGITHTDTSRIGRTGRLTLAQGTRFITPSSPDGLLMELADISTPTDTREGRAAAYSLLDTNSDRPANAGFRRLDADTHVLFITAHDDSSRVPASSEWSRWMIQFGYQPLTTHAIVGLEDTCVDYVERGDSYLAYADGTGGEAFDLCAPDWSVHATRLVDSFARRKGVRPLHTPNDHEPMSAALLDDDGLHPVGVERPSYALILETGATGAQRVVVRYTPDHG